MKPMESSTVDLSFNEELLEQLDRVARGRVPLAVGTNSRGRPRSDLAKTWVVGALKVHCWQRSAK
jgi:hypothetical protein